MQRNYRASSKLRLSAMKNVLLFIFFLFMLAHDAFPQSAKTKKLFRIALEAYHHHDTSKTDRYLQKCIRLDSTFADAWRLKAEVDIDRGHFDEAIRTYTSLIDKAKTTPPDIYYSLGHLQFSRGFYDDAAQSLNTFLLLTKKQPSAIRTKAQKLLQSARFAGRAVKHPTTGQLHPLSSQINTPAEEYINFVAVDERRFIFTRKYVTDTLSQDKPVYKEQLFESAPLNNGRFKTSQPWVFSWAMGHNMGGISLTADQRTLYFAACYWPGSVGSCDLYESRWTDHQWQRPHHLETTVNSHAWDSQACISPDGHFLFFASKRPGGKGGSDIWMSVKDGRGRWMPALNLGDSINTAGDEMAPFLHADNQSLYFSSNGRPGMGGFDLFLARKDSTGHWQSPVNLGYPINTRADEINLFAGMEGGHAWISSNRGGNMDIYACTLSQKAAPLKTLYIQGKVEDEKTGKPLEAKVILTDYLHATPLDSTWSSPTDGRFLMVLHPGRTQAFHILKKDYLFYSKHLTFDDTAQLHNLSAVFRLTPIQKNSRMPLENILFDLDRAELRPEALSELNLVVQMLKTQPEIKIRIAGYTDATGSKTHNLLLSTQRAKAVYDYLIKHGIDSNRLEYKGYGEAKSTGNTPSAALRAQNRRTEIIIR